MATTEQTKAARPKFDDLSSVKIDLGDLPEDHPAPMSQRVIALDPKLLKLLELNARFMRHEEYTQLVKNIRKDGRLTSVPFACLNEGHSLDEPDDTPHKWKVLSGNHRTQAAIAAGLKHIVVMVTEDELSNDQQIGIQLSHNAIAGQDDPAILRELYEQIKDVDYKLYVGFDDEMLKLLDEVKLGTMNEANLTFRTVSITLLPEEVEYVTRCWEEAKHVIVADKIYLGSMKQYDKLLDSLEHAGKAHRIMNVATQLLVILDIFRRNIGQLKEGYLDEDGEATHKDAVPMISVFGDDDLPAPSAAIVHRALAKMIKDGHIDEENQWKAIELWAADYLSHGGDYGA